MKTEIELRESALNIAEKITPFKNFDEVAKTADKVLAYITKDSELKFDNTLDTIMGAITPLIYVVMTGVIDANDKKNDTEVESEIKQSVEGIEPKEIIKKGKA